MEFPINKIMRVPLTLQVRKLWYLCTLASVRKCFYSMQWAYVKIFKTTALLRECGDCTDPIAPCSPFPEGAPRHELSVPRLLGWSISNLDGLVKMPDLFKQKQYISLFCFLGSHHFWMRMPVYESKLNRYPPFTDGMDLVANSRRWA